MFDRPDTIKFPNSAVRWADTEQERFDLIPQVGLRRLAETCAEGAAKHGDRTWEAGMPASTMINRVLRHINLYLLGDDAEDHLAHAAWRLLALCDYEERRPEMIDLPDRQPGESWKPPGAA